MKQMLSGKLIIMMGILGALVFTCLAGAQVLAQTTNESYIAPRLNVDIPGLEASDFQVSKGAGGISVPFLAAYIFAFYKYILGVSLIAAAIIMIYGGYLYLLGATGLEVADGKQKIIDALVGLVIILGTYTILANLNPNTLTLKSLNIEEIPTDYELLRLLSQNNTAATSPDGIDATNAQIVPDPEIEAVKPVLTGARKAIMAIEKDKLYLNTMPSLSGQSFQARVRQAAEIFQDCKINLGYCGQVVQTTWAVAGVGKVDCLLDSKKTCWSDSKEFFANVTTIGGVSDKTWAFGRLCSAGNKCLSVADSLDAKGKTKSAETFRGYFRPSGECGLNASQARVMVREHFESQDSGYPRNLTDKLEPGDWIESYSANAECDGLHSQIFLGWHESKPGVAWIFDGSVKQNPRIRERCFDKRCSYNYWPITKIYRPNQENLR